MTALNWPFLGVDGEMAIKYVFVRIVIYLRLS